MNTTMSEVLQFVQENDVKFIRLVFSDIFGNLKNISVTANELPTAFQNGVSFDACAIEGFMKIEESDLFLHPDCNTLCILPWRPRQGSVVRMFCDIRHPDGREFEGDCRRVLASAVARAEAMGLSCKIGSECEFYLFELDENGAPTLTPHDRAGYLSMAPEDKGENIRREICLTLEQMGIEPLCSHHEQGPGQNEIDFRCSNPLTAADDLVTFQTVVKTIAEQGGLHATFMPKPLAEQSGNGLHINMSLLNKEGVNLFRTGPDEGHCREAESFIAGVMDKVREMTAILNPLPNSYRRFGKKEAPGFVTWSHQNRSQLIRIPAAQGEKARMELRSADPSCNPYLAFALLLHAGLDGVEQGKPLCPPSDFDCFSATDGQMKGIAPLPSSLEEALELGRNSTFLKRVLPQKILNTFFDSKEREIAEYQRAIDKSAFEHNRYF